MLPINGTNISVFSPQGTSTDVDKKIAQNSVNSSLPKANSDQLISLLAVVADKTSENSVDASDRVLQIKAKMSSGDYTFDVDQLAKEIIREHGRLMQ